MPEDLSDQSAELIPFHALNEFMRNTYRLTVIRTTLTGMSQLSKDRQKSIGQLTKKLVQVPGFRNSEKAPATVKAVPMVKAFEKSPELVAAILAAWADINPDLRQQVYDLLVERNWSVLPLEGERTKLPGFFVQWPEEESFESLDAAFREKYPETTYSDDDINLMIVWVSSRLPFKHVPLADIPPLTPEAYFNSSE